MISKLTVSKNGNKNWLNKKKELHREDGPALEWANGDRWWCIDGRLHRIEGPAAEYAEGDKFWCVVGNNITRLVRELLSNSPFGEDVHLGILAEYFAERNDFRLLEIVQPYLEEEK